MNEQSKVSYLFDDWNNKLIEVAQDAIECCITSAYLNYGSLGFLHRLAKLVTKVNNDVTGTPIKILIDSQFAPTGEMRAKIIDRLLLLPGVEVRVHKGENLLHRKNYIFRTKTDVRVVIGSVNATYSGFFDNIESAAVIYHDISDLEGQKIQNSFRQLWDVAIPIERKDEEAGNVSIPMFVKGENVKIISTGKIGTVNDVKPGSSSVSYRVTVEGIPRMYQEKALEKFVDEEEEIYSSYMSGEIGCDTDFSFFQTWFRLKKPIEGQLYSYLGSRTTFNPFQFKPLIKFLSTGSEERLFIADEVGVGKTIETGIVMTELLARQRIDSKSPILIVCPNTLGPKWEKEMRERFNLHFHLHDGSTFRYVLKTVLESGVVPEKYCWGIVSLNLLRQENELMKKIEIQRIQPIWDFTVIDEAHHMRNVGTESNTAGNSLSLLSDMLLMLSATPLNLRDEDLFNQMNILNPAFFPDVQTFQAILSPVKSLNRCRRLLNQNTLNSNREIQEELTNLKAGPLGQAIASHPGIQELELLLQQNALLPHDAIAKYQRMIISLSPLDLSFTRTLKREALGHRVLRQTEKVPVELTAEEKAFHDSVIELVQQAYLARGGTVSALGFISNMPRRMVSSCIPAMKEYLEWCLATNSFIPNESQGTEDAGEDSEISAQEMSADIRTAFQTLKEQAEKLGQIDTKFQEFLNIVRQMRSNLENPRIIVFSFFVRTLKHLQKKLAAEGYKVGLICGEVPVISDGITPTRYDIIDALEKNEIDILLSSEVGGEGLDFQFCQAIINYDLPYNPMRIEQRIGRIDRFGQKAEKVIIASMFIKDTVDQRIYELLYERINLVQDSVGDLEPILGSKFVDLQKDIIEGKLSSAQIEQRMREIKIAIEQARLEMEAFENNRRELMGEDFFTTPLQNLQSNVDFVHPGDAARLTAMCLHSWSGCDIKALDQDRALVTLSADKVASLESFMRIPNFERSIKEVGRLGKGPFPIAVVFNGEIADQFKDHVFLPPCGFWTRFLLKQLENEKRIYRSFAVRCNAEDIDLDAGQYLVPLFEIKLEGFRVEISLVGVPVSLENNKVVSVDVRVFAEALRRVKMQSVESGAANPVADPYMLVDVAREAVDLFYEPLLQELHNENKYRVDSRIMSLRRGADARIEKMQKMIQDHKERAQFSGEKLSHEFIRLTEARIKHEQQRTDDKIDSLKGKNELSKAVSLAGLVLLNVDSK